MTTVMMLVALAGALAGTVLLAASTVVDLRLQAEMLEHMSRAHPGCGVSCVAERTEAGLQLQLVAGALGALLMVVTNLVVVPLVVAFRGGRLVLVGTRRPGQPRLPAPECVLVLALVGAAAIHAAVVPEHLGEWWAAGAFFVLLATAELLAAATLAWSRRRSRPGPAVPALLATLGVSVLPLLVWAQSRTSGMPFGPEAWEREPVGVADVMACVLEVVAAVVVARTLFPGRRGRPGWTPYRTAIATAAVVAVTVIGLGGSGISGFEPFSGGGGHHETGEGA